MFFDEDGDLAHEFYTEQRVEVKAGVVRWVMRKVSSAHLTPQVSLSLCSVVSCYGVILVFFYCMLCVLFQSHNSFEISHHAPICKLFLPIIYMFSTRLLVIIMFSIHKHNVLKVN